MTIIRRFVFELGRYDVTGYILFRSNKFVILIYLNILKTEEILQFWDKKILDERGTSFQRKRLNNPKISTNLRAIAVVRHANIYGDYTNIVLYLINTSRHSAYHTRPNIKRKIELTSEHTAENETHESRLGSTTKYSKCSSRFPGIPGSTNISNTRRVPRA